MNAAENFGRRSSTQRTVPCDRSRIGCEAVVDDSRLKQCSYFLVRYVPDVVKEEFLNIGLFLFCPSEHFLDCMFSDDFRRVARFHAQADTEFLKDLQPHFEQQIGKHEEDLDGFIQEMQQSYSNLIQLSPLRTCLAADLGAQLRDLFERHVGTHLASPARQNTRMRIRRQMTEALRRCGVLDCKSFERRIPASAWTTGDPLVFDFGYKPNGRLKLIHSLSLQRDPELAEVLKGTFDRVLVKQSCHVTVGHEDEPDPNDPVVHFSQTILQHDQIRLVPASGFDEYARSVRAELSL
jgi:hypothetical protein